MAAIAGFPAEHNATITGAQHHNDPDSRASFMRTAFHDNGKGLAGVPALAQAFAERVDHSQPAEDLTVVGSELETVALNRAIKWHAERRLFRNGRKTVVLR